MNREQAEREAADRSRAGPRGLHRWFARPDDDDDDDGSLVKVAGLPVTLVRPFTAVVEAKPKPAQADDPRPMSGAT
jgi:hypothetical protein